MSANLLHDWNSHIEAIMTDIYNTAYARGKASVNTDCEEQSQWTPCSERLPEEHFTYLVTIKNASGSTFTTTSYFFTAKTGWSHDGVIAWMPFPTPYREEGDLNG